MGWVVYGAASIGNLYRPVEDDEAQDVLEAAWDAGIRSFDTAPHYGLGLSERRLGAFLRTRERASFQLSTKVGRILEPRTDPRPADDMEHGFAVPADTVRRFDPSRSGIERSVADSLERLGLDRVDTLLLHDPDVYDLDRGLREGLPALATLRDEGVTGEVGIGVNSVEAAVRAVREGDIDVVMIAGRYTLLEQHAAEELLPLCLERGVRIIAVGVFNSGLLAAATPASAHYDYGAVPADLVERTERLRAVCTRHDVPLPCAALQFPLRHPAIGQIAIGTARRSSLAQNVEYLRAQIPAALWSDLEAEGLIPPQPSMP
ncbi:aldo/keto reductase [Ornithinimicrobium pratense]|uniref:Aldo/keto reductase n=1 Tax=Ornithinimicrobium pratense TaxID=2593973 RepID=A0A5J6V985_9MICO|nr:aldo/keto reductase [Ornithinimicrobium pratense]QFG70338.1 aldo/keto reductase [Ornithinimicrobium pratense]